MGENNFAPVTVAAYGTLYLLCGAAFTLLQRTLSPQQKNNPKLVEALDKATRKGMFSLVAYSASIPLAFVHPGISGFLYVAVAVVWIIPDRNIEKALEQE